MAPSYLDNVSVENFTMDANLPHSTILRVITLCVCLCSFYGQDGPFLEFFVLFIVVVVVVIVVSSHLLGMDWSVVMSLGTIICLPERGAGVGGLSFVQLSPLILCHRRRDHSRGELPICKRLVCPNTYGHHYLTFRQY